MRTQKLDPVFGVPFFVKKNENKIKDNFYRFQLNWASNLEVTADHRGMIHRYEQLCIIIMGSWFNIAHNPVAVSVHVFWSINSSYKLSRLNSEFSLYVWLFSIDHQLEKFRKTPVISPWLTFIHKIFDNTPDVVSPDKSD